MAILRGTTQSSLFITLINNARSSKFPNLCTFTKTLTSYASPSDDFLLPPPGPSFEPINLDKFSNDSKNSRGTGFSCLRDVNKTPKQVGDELQRDLELARAKRLKSVIHTAILSTKDVGNYLNYQQEKYFTYRKKQQQGYTYREQGYELGQFVNKQNFPKVQTKEDGLVGLCRDGKTKEFYESLDKGVNVDPMCFSLVFELYGESKNLEEATKIHAYFLRSKFRADPNLLHKLIEMYLKCGKALTIDTYNTMINSCAKNRLGKEGLALYEELHRVGLSPNEETFLAILGAFATVEDRYRATMVFEAMGPWYGVSPGKEHLVALIHVYGKCGCVSEILEGVKNWPVEASDEAEIQKVLDYYCERQFDVWKLEVPRWFKCMYHFIGCKAD